MSYDRGRPPRAGLPEGLDPELADLRRRLDALMVAVERLGAEGGPRDGSRPAVPAYGEPGAVPSAGPMAQPVDEAVRHDELLPHHEPLPHPSAPTVVHLDVGPFLDLIDLRHFEEAVARLDAIRGVRVLDYARNRARIDVGLTAPVAVGHQLEHLGRPLRLGTGADDELIVDFADVGITTADLPPGGRETA